PTRGATRLCTAVADAKSDQAQTLIEVLLILRFEIVITQTGDPPLGATASSPRCKIIHSRCHIGSSFLFPRRLSLRLRVRNGRRTSGGRSPPPDSRSV